MSSAEYPANARVGVGAVVFRDDAVLLVRRKQPPSAGEWAIPGGKVELGESLQQAAEREIREETGIHIRALDPVYAFDLIERDEVGKIKWHYVIVDLIADDLGGDIKAASDASEARWVTTDELPDIDLNQASRFLLEEVLGFA